MHMFIYMHISFQSGVLKVKVVSIMQKQVFIPVVLLIALIIRSSDLRYHFQKGENASHMADAYFSSSDIVSLPIMCAELI